MTIRHIPDDAQAVAYSGPTLTLPLQSDCPSVEVAILLALLDTLLGVDREVVQATIDQLDAHRRVSPELVARRLRQLHAVLELLDET